jgi:hypothetical protein
LIIYEIVFFSVACAALLQVLALEASSELTFLAYFPLQKIVFSLITHFAFVHRSAISAAFDGASGASTLSIQEEILFFITLGTGVITGTDRTSEYDLLTSQASVLLLVGHFPLITLAAVLVFCQVIMQLGVAFCADSLPFIILGTGKTAINILCACPTLEAIKSYPLVIIISTLDAGGIIRL